MGARVRSAAVCLVVVAILVGCADSHPSGGPTRSASPSLAEEAEEIPDSPAGRQLGSVLVWLADGPPDAQVVEEHFADSFLKAAPPDQVRTVFESLAGSYRLVRFLTEPSTHELAAVIEHDTGQRLRVHVAVEPDAPHRMTGLLFQPDRAEVDLERLEALPGRLAELAQDHAALIAEVDEDGGCDPVVASHPDRALAIGSIIKLYVLDAVAAAVQRDELAWDEPVIVRDELRSIPPGPVHEMPRGRSLTVRQMAEHMIAASDNSATDHLIAAVGRTNVERSFEELGHHDPQRNVPLITTRELTLLKWGVTPETRQGFLEADVQGKRDILNDQLAGRPVPLDELDIDPQKPAFIDQLEWFASPADLCRALARLTDGEPTVREILAENPGLPEQRSEAWTYTAFKGGSEPGVFAAAWFLEDRSGTSYVTVVILNDTTDGIDMLTANDLATATIALLAQPGE